MATGSSLVAAGSGDSRSGLQSGALGSVTRTHCPFSAEARALSRHSPVENKSPGESQVLVQQGFKNRPAQKGAAGPGWTALQLLDPESE